MTLRSIGYGLAVFVCGVLGPIGWVQSAIILISMGNVVLGVGCAVMAAVNVACFFPPVGRRPDAPDADVTDAR